MRRNALFLFCLICCLFWLAIFYFTSVEQTDHASHRFSNQSIYRRYLEDRISNLEKKLSEQKHVNSLMLEKIQEAQNANVGVDGILKLLEDPSIPMEELVRSGDGPREAGLDGEIVVEDGDVDSREITVLPVLLFACNRVTVSRAIDLLIKYRPSKEQFPIIVTQDCGHKETRDVIESYGDEIISIQQPDLSEPQVPAKEAKFKGYFKIARHYGWALNQTFHHFGHQQVIVVEDDLEIAPDFFEYFLATLPLLRSDPSLWCVSAWNDNGKQGLIDETSPELLYRTDFFPGLGWMITKELWGELGSKWPRSYWDDWMREPQQRRERACIRPEISRTKTFGKIGVSNGLFFEKHLKFIVLSQKPVRFTVMNLDYLKQNNYDISFVREVLEMPVVKIEDLAKNQHRDKRSVRLIYHTREAFKRMARELGIMDDFKSGVPRMAYRGIVSCMYKGIRVYLAPNINWKGYDPKW